MNTARKASAMLQPYNNRLQLSIVDAVALSVDLLNFTLTVNTFTSDV